MKTLMRTLLLTLGVVLMAVTARAQQEKTLVILSTNDMHAKIQNFPRLATAVRECRDTAQMVVLVDAGDRWTGNAFVDMAPTPGMPIIRLMNKLGYDVATLGNHEFDHGQAFLGQIIDSMDFEVVCANIKSDTCTFPQLLPYKVVKFDDNEPELSVGFVGVVTNYEGPGHPAGNASSFVGLEFPDPQQAAIEYGAELRPSVDVMVLVSHMGDDRDMELLRKDTQYDLVIGGHTHALRDTLINGTLLTQTGKDLKNVGVTTIKLRGKQIEGVDYRLIPLSRYAPDPEYQQLVDADYADPELNKPIGSLTEKADRWGLANWITRVIAEEADADLGIYHVGGIRIDSIAAGDVGLSRIYDLEPFGSQIATIEMTPEQIRRMILVKYNDPVNLKEAHRVDLVATFPYYILVDEKDNAYDVLFPTLRKGRAYKVAMGDYIFKNYKEIDRKSGKILDDGVAEALIEDLKEHSPLTPDNEPHQRRTPPGVVVK